MINIAIRTDSSSIIGTGHVMRCLALVNKLTEHYNVNTYFFCRDNKGSINNTIQEYGHQVILMKPAIKDISSHLKHGNWLGASIENDYNEFKSLVQKNINTQIDYLIVDHYAIDINWHKNVKDFVKKIIVIDDLADRNHDCDYIIDQTFKCPENKYNNLIPNNSLALLGTKYAMLRSEFIKKASKENIISIRQQRKVKKLLIMFGGTDPDNLTLESLKLMITANIYNNFESINVIIGKTATHKQSILSFCVEYKNITVNVEPNNISQLMFDADLAIGAAGTASWERCSLGLPSIIIIQAANQLAIAKALSDAHISLVFTKAELKKALTIELPRLINNQEKLTKMIKNSLSVCDGFGCQRIIERIFPHV